jgi:hypothetical protein
MSFIQTPSLASATSTRVDSACKHIQQCRVSYDHMLDFVDTPFELEKNKMNYCVHKDEIVVGVARPWDKERVRMLPISAYPRIISNLGDITAVKYDLNLRMLKYLYHFSTSLQKRQTILNQMATRSNTIDHAVPANQHYFESPSGQRFNLQKQLAKMYDFYPVGVANTLGYAHPNSGDTMSSVMIGGLRTIMNGDFEVFAGDQIQWYWTFERDCFRDDGTRKSITNALGIVQDGANPILDLTGPGQLIPPQHNDPARRLFNDLQYGDSNSKAKHVARIKSYLKDEAHPRIYDWQRVFAVAISSASKDEMVDIKICRQSM